MAAKLTRLTHRIAIQLHLVAESCTICSSRSRWPVRKLWDTTSYSYILDSKLIIRLTRETERAGYNSLEFPYFSEKFFGV
jgi:hypothetical protein